MRTTITPSGQFSLAAAASFAEGFPGFDAGGRADEGVSITWAVDGDWRTVTATVRQRGNEVQIEVVGAGTDDLARRATHDAECIFSLDVDAAGFAQLGLDEPVVAGLQDEFPGLRPVLFFTPFEAAAWTIVGQRIRMTQAAMLRRRLAAGLGERGAFPAPERLAGLTGPQPGLSDRKVGQLQALGRAAADGRLSRERLRGMDPEEAVHELRQLPGIGPFSAELILIRGVGLPDVLPRHERRFERAARAAYGLADDADIEPIAEAWRPFRAWVALLLRARLEAAR